jgi:hypothetical protein
MTSRKAKRENSIPMHGVIEYCNARNGMHAPPFAKTHPKIIVQSAQIKFVSVAPSHVFID